MKTITPVELQKVLAEQPTLALLDVRTPVEYAEVHVKQARNEPLNQLEPAQYPKTQPIYLICRNDTRSKIAADQFEAADFKDIVLVQGGTQAWIEAGLPVERGPVKVISLERQVRIAAGSLVVVGVVLGWFVHRAFFGLSAFVGAGLVFAGVTDTCGMGLLLAKAPWNSRKSP